jgi:light-independent protochlorophyllide reductase subunit B
MFREDAEFHDGVGPSHLAGAGAAPARPVEMPSPTAPLAQRIEPGWAPEAEEELGKIPFFVRGKARRNTEWFAREQGVALITVETLYDAKAHFAR